MRSLHPALAAAGSVPTHPISGGVTLTPPGPAARAHHHRGSAQPEIELIDYLERLRDKTAQRLAIHVQLSRLQPSNRTQTHLHLAHTLFREGIAALDGQYFRLSNDDIVYVAYRVEPRILNQAIKRIRSLFADDPLLLHDRDGTGGPFCTWWVLEKQYTTFFDQMRSIKEEASFALDLSLAMAEPRGRPMSAAQLARMEEALRSCDVSALTRNQPVCLIDERQRAKVIFEEVYVSIRELADAMVPGTDLVVNRWLFQHLTLSLDLRLLRHMTREVPRRKSIFSLNLNVATVVGETFKEFDAQVTGDKRGRLVLEFHVVDVLSDLRAWRMSRDYAKERGYRLCLDGVTPELGRMLNREQLGADFFKVMWSMEMEAAPAVQSDMLTELVALAGHNRVILARCDTLEAIRMGMRCGVNLFQGRIMDRVRQTPAILSEGDLIE